MHPLYTVALPTNDGLLLLNLPMADQALPKPPADAGQRQKTKHIQRDFQEIARREHSEYEVMNIATMILLLWFFSNRQHMVDQQRLHNQHYSQSTNLRSQLLEHCDCPYKAKIVTSSWDSSTTTALFISNPITSKHHSKEKDKSVYLLYERENVRQGGC